MSHHLTERTMRQIVFSLLFLTACAEQIEYVAIVTQMQDIPAWVGTKVQFYPTVTVPVGHPARWLLNVKVIETGKEVTINVTKVQYEGFNVGERVTITCDGVNCWL